MTLRRTAPRPVAAALSPLRDGWAPDTLLAEVQRVWEEAVGHVIAGEARPERERGGVLTVTCSASVWAQELDLMAPTILTKLNEHLRRGRLTRLRCVTGT
jgi:predicted nucleic acid-binding Zn ribbon protein